VNHKKQIYAGFFNKSAPTFLLNKTRNFLGIVRNSSWISF